MTLDEIKAAEAKLLLPTYERNPILFVDGEGVHLIDAQGERYLDLLSGIGVNALGYGHPAIEQAIAEQSRKLIDRKSTRLNSSHSRRSRMPSSA